MHRTSFGLGGVCWTDKSMSLRKKDKKDILQGVGSKTRKRKLLEQLSVSVFPCASQGLLSARHHVSW